MAEFYNPFIKQLKEEIGVSDEIIMMCDAQIQASSTARSDPSILAKLKSGGFKDEVFSMSVVPDAQIRELHPKEFIRYFQHFGNNPSNLVEFPSYWTFSLEDAHYIAAHCPNYRGTIALGPMTTDFEILKLFNGKQLLQVSSVLIGSETDQRTTAISGESIKEIIKNLPNLTSLFVYYCRGIEPADWKCIKNSKIKSLGVLASNYKPEKGKIYCYIIIIKRCKHFNEIGVYLWN